MTCQTAEAAPPAPVSLPADAGGGSLSGGAIAGIAIGAAAGAVLLVCAALWMLRRRGQRRRAAGADHLDEEAHHAGEFASTGGKVSTGEQGSGGSPRKAQAGHGSGSAAGSVASLGSPLGSGALQPRGGLFQSRCAARACACGHCSAGPAPASARHPVEAPCSRVQAGRAATRTPVCGYWISPAAQAAQAALQSPASPPASPPALQPLSPLD